jgi:Spy/CpxP family protein refolding chaperone
MTRLVVVFGFLVAFAAGLVVGLRPRPAAPAPTTRPSRHGGWLAAELKLTPEQQEQMEKIWSETAFRGRHDREEQRRELTRQRDDAIANLIRPEDKPAYEEALKTFSDRTEALDNESRLAFQAAVEQTKQILSPQQRTRYEQFRQRQESERGRRDWRGRDRDSDRGRNDRKPSPPAGSQK